MMRREWKRGRRGLVIAAAGVMMLGVLAACSSGDDDKSEGGSGGLMTLRYEHSKGLSGLPIEIAYERDLFTKHGLKIVDKEISPGPAGMAALGKQFDVLQTSNQGVFDAIAAGRKDVVFFGGLGLSTKDSPAFPAYAADKSIKSWADLKGKTIGVSSLTGFATTTIDYLAKKNGVDPKTIKKVIVPFAQLPDQLKAGRVDAGWSIKPYALILDQAGYNSLGDPTLEATGQDELLASVHATTRDFAKNHLKELEAFQATLTEATEWMQANPEEAKKIAIKWLNLPADIINGQDLPTVKINITAADLEPMFPVFKDAGILQDLPPLDTLLAPTAK